MVDVLGDCGAGLVDLLGTHVGGGVTGATAGVGALGGGGGVAGL